MAEPCACLCVCRCGGCGAVFHAECRQKAQPCPRCVRRELHHTRPSSFWSPDDDSPGCFHLPYHDNWDACRRRRPPRWTKCLFLILRGWARSGWCSIRSVLTCVKPMSESKEQGENQQFHQALQTELRLHPLTTSFPPHLPSPIPLSRSSACKITAKLTVFNTNDLHLSCLCSSV